MVENLRLARRYLLLLALCAVGRWLMGTFGVGFQLADDLDRVDWAWVSDPRHPDRNADGPLGEVIYARHRALGLLD